VTVIQKTLAVLLLQVPIYGFWAIEMTLASGPHSFDRSMMGPLTVGPLTWDGVVVYHFWMYAIIVVATVSALVILCYHPGDKC